MTDFQPDKGKNLRALFAGTCEVIGVNVKAAAAEEREREPILLDYYEYLTELVEWFTRTKHHSLDGG